MALRQFQQVRGLHVTGSCDEHTWKALVEASWQLGDRMLVLTSPNMRGDDVADLQGRLGRLGFDCGRVDGIFGPQSARALTDFQSNCGITTDGVCGTLTLRMLQRVSGQTGSGPGVASVREHERLLTAPGSVASLRIVVGQFGGLSIISRAVTRELRAAGAQVMSLDEPDAVAQAKAANHFAADVYLGLEGGAAAPTVIHYYQVPTFESVGGHTLATYLSRQLRLATALDVADPCGMRLPVLRETRMPAVLCVLAPVRLAVDTAAQITSSLVSAVEQWTDCPTLISQ